MNTTIIPQDNTNRVRSMICVLVMEFVERIIKLHNMDVDLEPMPIWISNSKFKDHHFNVPNNALVFVPALAETLTASKIAELVNVWMIHNETGHGGPLQTASLEMIFDRTCGVEFQSLRNQLKGV